jgi:hypothetical protein
VKWINISNKTDGKVIVTGPSHCAWAYFFLYHIPMLSTLRKNNPDAIIVSGGYLSDWWYTKKYCDYYVGHPIDNNVRTMIGRNHETKNPTTNDLVELTKSQFGRVDSIISTDGDDRTTGRMYKQYLGILEKFPFKSDCTSNRIAIWGRWKPNCRRTINNGRKEHWDRTIEFLLNNGYDVSIMGSRGGSYASDRNDVKSFLDIDDMNRAEDTFKHLETCLCSLSNISAPAHFCQFIGHPLCIFNLSDREQTLMTDRNQFGTLTSFCVPKPWEHWTGPNPMRNHKYDDYKNIWEEHLLNFFDRVRTEPSYKTEISDTTFLKKYLG